MFSYTEIYEVPIFDSFKLQLNLVYDGTLTYCITWWIIFLPGWWYTITLGLPKETYRYCGLTSWEIQRQYQYTKQSKCQGSTHSSFRASSSADSKLQCSPRHCPWRQDSFVQRGVAASSLPSLPLPPLPLPPELLCVSVTQNWKCSFQIMGFFSILFFFL